MILWSGTAVGPLGVGTVNCTISTDIRLSPTAPPPVKEVFNIWAQPSLAFKNLLTTRKWGFYHAGLPARTAAPRVWPGLPRAWPLRTPFERRPPLAPHPAACRLLPSMPHYQKDPRKLPSPVLWPTINPVPAHPCCCGNSQSSDDPLSKSHYVPSLVLLAATVPHWAPAGQQYVEPCRCGRCALFGSTRCATSRTGNTGEVTHMP